MKIINILKNQKRILGINERNIKYIRPHNKRKAKRIADNKLLTKKVLSHHNISTPKLVATIENIQELEHFDWDSLPRSFVIKPVSGLEGGGIEIFYNRDKHGNWIRADKTKFSLEEMKQHARGILDGKFSLRNLPDKILFEERVRTPKVFRYYSYKGAPDIRLIVFNNIPIMSYVRLPTKRSNGKGNLAMGAIGAAIDLSTGVTTTAIIGKSTSIEKIPGTTLRVSGLEIPFWKKILRYSVAAQRATNLGFAAIDFLIDRDRGPMIVELNSRPGLSIQLANQDGIKWRLEKAQGIKVKTISQGVRLGKDLFGGKIEEGIENITGKEVIGFIEKVKIYGKEIGQNVIAKAKIDSGALFTSIDRRLAKKLGYKDALEYFKGFEIPENLTRKQAKEFSKKHGDEMLEHEDIISRVIVHSSHGTTIRPTFSIPIKISGKKINIRANIADRKRLIYPIIIGRRDLDQFIIDPTKTYRSKNK